MSTWLRDYLYIPLGGNRLGGARTYLNLMVVMLLGGFWHGASWNFLIWGGIHGGMLAFERAQGRDSFYRRLPTVVRIGITFLIVCLAWVFFRAETLPQAVAYLSSLCALAPTTTAAMLLPGVMYSPYHLLVFGIAALLVWCAPQTWTFTRELSPVRAAVCMLFLLLSVLFMWTQTENPFLYFQF